MWYSFWQACFKNLSQILYGLGFFKLPANSKMKKIKGKANYQEWFQNLDTGSVKTAIKSISVINLALNKLK